MSSYFQDSVQKLQTSLQENWAAFIEQVPGILMAILIVSVGLLLSKKISNLTRKAISNKTKDLIMINFLSKAIKIVLSAISIMFALNVAGLDGIATGVLTAAGASAVIIGFAFRDIGENFISGIILSFNRPFNVDDTVSIGDIFGKIKNIEFRYTKVRTFDGRDVYIPNSDVIKKPVYNYTEDGFFRFDFIVGIAYENDIKKAEKLIMKITNNTPKVYSDASHSNFVYTDSLGVSTVNLKVQFWIKTFEYGMEALLIKGNVIANVKQALLLEGFGLPADISEIKLYDAQAAIPINIKKES
jgi:small-conductance mechanosensitive channel